jgi:hypothetical protein
MPKPAESRMESNGWCWTGGNIGFAGLLVECLAAPRLGIEGPRSQPVPVVRPAGSGRTRQQRGAGGWERARKVQPARQALRLRAHRCLAARNRTRGGCFRLTGASLPLNSSIRPSAKPLNSSQSRLGTVSFSTRRLVTRATARMVLAISDGPKARPESRQGLQTGDKCGRRTERGG